MVCGESYGRFGNSLCRRNLVNDVVLVSLKQIKLETRRNPILSKYLGHVERGWPDSGLTVKAFFCLEDRTKC